MFKRINLVNIQEFVFFDLYNKIFLIINKYDIDNGLLDDVITTLNKFAFTKYKHFYS